MAGVVGLQLSAEAPASESASQNTQNTNVNVNRYPPPDRIDVFDKKVFEVGKPPDTNQTSKSVKGTVRPVEQPTENAAITEEAREECAAEKARGMKAFRTCYQQAKKRRAKALQENMQSVEFRQRQTFRNSQSLPNDALDSNSEFVDEEQERD